MLTQFTNRTEYNNAVITCRHILFLLTLHFDLKIHTFSLNFFVTNYSHCTTFLSTAYDFFHRLASLEVENNKIFTFFYFSNFVGQSTDEGTKNIIAIDTGFLYIFNLLPTFFSYTCRTHTRD